MKGKFKRVAVVLTVILCMAVLCVPAFASDGKTYILENFVVPDEGYAEGFYSTSLVVGQTYYITDGFEEPIAVVCEYLEDIEDGVCANFLQTGNFLYAQILTNGGYILQAPAGLTISIYSIPEPTVAERVSEFGASLTPQLNAIAVIEVLACTAGACVLGVFLWWGVRKASRGVRSAFLRGKLKL